MIEGIKVTVLGEELRQLCLNRADYHIERSDKYDAQIKSMEASRIEGMAYTNGDPVQSLKDRQATHDQEESELQFIADHLELTEKYHLSSADLQKIGITKSRY